ncbi:MAG: TIGR00341 family protein [Cryomorphaceae bacterium]|nr:TIGR00341 family protein [Cryomorphaceae bacterium]
MPRGETVSELTRGPLPFILHASTEEFKELFQVLRENATPKASYLVLMVLSTILATFGLFANSAPVVIGAMILAPLMSPIISLSMGTLRQDKGLIINSIYTIASGLGLAFLCSVLITLLTPLNAPNAEILSRTSPNLLDLGIAVFSGVAGAYAHAREEVAKTLAGVAIAVALVPPLAVAGIGLGWFDGGIFFGATLLLLTNLAGMVLAGAFTFLLLGFSPFRLAQRGLLISAAIVLLLSIPLGLGFYKMVYESNVVERIESWERDDKIQIKDVQMLGLNPLTISVRLISDHTLSDSEIDKIKEEIEERLGKKVSLEVNVTVKR